MGQGYLCCGYGPDLEIIWPHEEVRNTGTHHPHNPLVKVLRLCICYAGFQCCFYHAVHALDLLFFGQHRDIILERVRDPQIFTPHIGDTLVCKPIRLFRQSFVDAVIKVLVMGEDDMAANIVKLSRESTLAEEDRVLGNLRSLQVLHQSRQVHRAFRCSLLSSMMDHPGVYKSFEPC